MRPLPTIDVFRRRSARPIFRVLWLLDKNRFEDCACFSLVHVRLQLAAEFLPVVRILHPWPQDRFAVNHPRWKPGA